MAVISDEYITVFSAQFNELSQAESALRSMRTQIEQNNDVLRSFDNEIATARGQMAELVGRMNDLRQAGQGNSQAFKDLQAQYQSTSAAARRLSAEKRNLTLEARSLKDEETKAAASVKELDAALRKQIATAEASKLTFDKLKTAVSDLSSGMMRAGGLISGFVTAPIAAISEMGRSFETTLRQVAANTAMTDAQLGQMRDTIIGMGRNTSASMDDLAKGYMHVTNFGFEAADATRILDAAMKDAVATGTQTEAVANTLAGVLHEFGLSGGEAANVMNTLALAAAHGNLTLEQFTSVSGRVFSTAANLGLSLNEAAAAMSALTRAGFPAEQASTQLVGALTHLVNPAGQAKDEIKALSKATGIDLVHDFSQAGLQSKGLSGVLADLKLAIGDNTAEALKLFGGIRGGLGVMALIGNAQKDYTQLLRETSETMAGKLSPTTEAYNREVQSLSFQFGELKNRLTILGDVLNGAFSHDQISFVKGLNDAVSGLTEGFKSLDPAMQAAVATFLGAFAISGPILLGVGALVTLIGGPLTIAIVGVSTALSILAADWLSTTDKSKSGTESLRQSVLEIIPALGMIADLLGIVGNAALAMSQMTIAGFRATTQVLTGDWAGAMKTIEENQRFTGRAISNIWDELNGKWEGVLTRLVNSAFSASSGFSAAGRANAAAYQSGLNSALSGSLSLKTPLDKFVTPAAPQTFNQAAIEAGARVTGTAAGKALTDGIATGIKAGGGKIKAAVDETFNAVTDWMRSSNLGDLSKSVWDKLAKSVKDSLKSQADDFHKSKDELQTYKANIIALMDGLGFEVIKANNAIGVSFKQSADTIAITSAQVGTSIRGITEGIGPAFDQLQKDSAAATVGLIADSQKRVENYNAEQKAADDSFRSLAAHVESMGHDIPEGLRKITDGFVMMSGKTGEAMLLMLQKVRGWGHDVVQVIETLPGKFGDVARGILKTVDQWIVFFDRVLQLAHRFNDSIPESVEAAISKITGVFKKSSGLLIDTSKMTQDEIQKAAKNASQGLDEISDSMKKSSDSAQGAAKQWVAAIATITGSIATFFGTRGQGKLTGILGGIGAGAAIGSLFGPLGTAIGAGAGALLGLFGTGQSSAVKEAAKQAAERAKIDMQQAAQTVINSALEGFNKALEFMNNLDEFTAPRKAKFREFFKALTKLMDGFVALAKSWGAGAFDSAKSLAEAIGPIADAIGGSLTALDGINSFIAPASKIVDEFFASLTIVIAKFGELADSVPMQLAKHASKFANKLSSVVEVISGAMLAFMGDGKGTPGLVDFKGIPAAAFDAFKVGIQLAVQRMGEIADSIDAGMVKQASRFSDRAKSVADILKSGVEGLVAIAGFTGVPAAAFEAFGEGIKAAINIFIGLADQLSVELLGRAVVIANAVKPIADAIKAWAEAAKLIHDYSSVASDTYDAILADFNRAISLINLMLGSAIDFLPKAIQFEDVMVQIANHLKAALDAFGPGLGAAASAFGLIVNTIQGGVPIGGGDLGGGSFAPSYAAGSFAGGASASSSAVHVHVHAGTFVHESQLPDLIAEGLVKLKRTSRLQGILAT